MKWILILLAVLIGALSVSAQEPIERIVAVVGQEPIMASELAAQIQMMAIQNNIRPKDEEEMLRMQKDVLDQMINERLFLIEAKNDTSLHVSDADIDQALDQHIARVASQFSSEDQFLDELSKEGMSLRQFKKKMRPEIENQLYKQRMIQRKISEISISKQEVYKFYEDYKDSIPVQPEAVRLAHILITFQPSKTTEDSVRSVAEAVRQNVVSGADFTAMAIKYSQGPASINGGDLGFVSSADVIPEFGNVAFHLETGEISGVIRTPMGYHIIKCEEKKKDRSHLRHILFQVEPTAIDSSLSYKLVDSLINELNNGVDFKELAKVYSADDDSRKTGGELGWFGVADLPPGFAEAIPHLDQNDKYYGPVKTEYGLHILKRLDYQTEKKLNPDDDYDQIKDMARQSKTGEFVESWLETVKDKTFVEVRL